MTREERVREREEFLIRSLEIIKEKYMAEAKPIGEELMAIRESRGVPDLCANGKCYRYTGPLPPYHLPEEL